jgi:general L-amino acid transport system permease protein
MAVATQDGMNVPGTSYVRATPVEAKPAPGATTGVVGWVRANLLSSPSNIVLTIISILLVIWIVPPLIEFMLTHAVWNGADREACLPTAERPEVGACWPFVKDRFAYFIYGSYPIPERWRVDVFFAMLAVGIFWLLWLEAPRRDLGALYFFVVVPVFSYVLLNGMDTIGLRRVDTSLWGGVLVTMVVSWVGIVFSLPVGILLALGRRSTMPAVKLFSVIFIEFVRGVPLITVLFMANTMLPLFLPEGMTIDRLMRPLVGVAVFAAAYMAEVVRGGLQAIPQGQYEGAMSLGLKYPHMMVFIVLPQALKIVIPGIVNTFIGLFKDTTLVTIVGIFDFIKTIEASRIDPAWAAPTINFTGYAFAALFYFVFCFGMSRYSLMVERRLATGHTR